MESKQARMSWSEGWHEVSENFSYYVENGCLIRGTSGKGITYKTVYPYLPCKDGGYDNASGIKANKRNYDRLCWF